MFLSEWRGFPSAPRLAGKKILDDSSRLHVVEIAGFSWRASESVSFLVGLGTYQHPLNVTHNLLRCFTKHRLEVIYRRFGGVDYQSHLQGSSRSVHWTVWGPSMRCPQRLPKRPHNWLASQRCIIYQKSEIVIKIVINLSLKLSLNFSSKLSLNLSSKVSLKLSLKYLLKLLLKPFRQPENHARRIAAYSWRGFGDSKCWKRGVSSDTSAPVKM